MDVISRSNRPNFAVIGLCKSGKYSDISLIRSTLVFRDDSTYIFEIVYYIFVALKYSMSTIFVPPVHFEAFSHFVK